MEQNIYTLEDLFVKYSTSLELKNKQTEEELWLLSDLFNTFNFWKFFKKQIQNTFFSLSRIG